MLITGLKDHLLCIISSWPQSRPGTSLSFRLVYDWKLTTLSKFGWVTVLFPNLIPTHIGRPSKTRNAAATHSYQWVLLQCNNEQDCKKVVGTDCYQLEDSIAVLKRCKNLRKILTLIFHIVSFLSKNGHAYLPRLQIYVKSKFFVKTKATCTLLKCW